MKTQSHISQTNCKHTIKYGSWIPLLLCLCILTASVRAQVPFRETGMVDLRGGQWGNVDNTGSTVVTKKLRDAINWCRTHQKTLYIPPGTYLVDQRIEIKCSSGGSNDDNSPHIHGDAYDRPVIKLRDGTFGGNPNPRNATPVFLLKNEVGDRGAPWNYWSVISNLDFDLGNNPGAVALNWASHQDSHLFNIKVYGKNFTAGFFGVTGTNQGNVNLEVDGGQYGVILTLSSGSLLTGIKLRNQSRAGVLAGCVRGNTIVGLDYSGPGPAIIQDRDYNYEVSHLYLQDAKINITNSSREAINARGRVLVMRNVYVSGTNKIVSSTKKNFTVNGSAGGWTHVKTYSIAQSPTNGRETFNYIDGSKKTDHEVKEFTTGARVPSNIMTKHLPDEVYAFNYPGAVNALKYPGSSTREKIQNAIDDVKTKVVYVPAGTFSIDNTIYLKKGKVLVGDPGKQTKFRPSYSAGNYKFVIETQNTNGYVALQDLFLMTKDNRFECGVKWQTSSGFMLNVRNFEGHGNKEKDTRAYEFSGQAGGKFYAVTDHRNILRDVSKPESVNHRKVYISGTVNPLTFYGMNLERGGAHRKRTSNSFCEIRNARNVRVFGSKAEPDEGNVFKVSNSNNITIASVLTHRGTGPAMIALDNNSNNVEIAIVAQASSSRTLISPYNDIKKSNILALFRKGKVDHGIFDGEAPDPGNTYMLTVNRGSGDGSYKAGTEVTITADPATPGESFDRWTGDVQSLSNADSATTTLVMPAQAITVSATYKKSVQEAYATHTIPGTIECEHYDKGGQGIAYNDDDRREGDPSFRPGDNIDIVAKPGASNGYSVGYSREGEWAEYTLADVATGTYDIQLSYSSGAPGAIGDLRVSLEGAELTTITDISNTGSWDTFTTVTVKDVPIPGGSDKVLRLAYVNGSRFDLDAITFEASGSDPGPGCDPGSVSVLAGEGVYTQGDQVYNTGILRVESDRRVSYVQFDVSNTCGRITGATLRVTNEANESGSGTFRVYKALHSGWNDNTTNISSLPSKSGPALSSFTDSNVQGGEVLEFDVTDAITGNGVVSFIIEHESGNDIKLYSDDVSNDLLRPELTISYGESKGAAIARKGTDTSFDPYLLKVYPNPNGGDFVIASEAPIGSIALFTSQGSPVAITSRISKDRFGARVSTRAPSGSYWLRIEYEGGRRAVKKVMVVR